MKIDMTQSVGPIRPSSPFPFEMDKVQGQPQSFGDMLKKVVENTNDVQVNASHQGMKLAMGEAQDVHEVMIAMEKASLVLQMTLEIRDRVVDAYERLIRSAM